MFVPSAFENGCVKLQKVSNIFNFWIHPTRYSNTHSWCCYGLTSFCFFNEGFCYFQIFFTVKFVFLTSILCIEVANILCRLRWPLFARHNPNPSKCFIDLSKALGQFLQTQFQKRNLLLTHKKNTWKKLNWSTMIDWLLACQTFVGYLMLNHIFELYNSSKSFPNEYFIKNLGNNYKICNIDFPETSCIKMNCNKTFT